MADAAHNKPFEVGDQVYVSGPPGEIFGEVLEAATIEEMPDLGLRSLSKGAKDVMREMRVAC